MHQPVEEVTPVPKIDKKDEVELKEPKHLPPQDEEDDDDLSFMLYNDSIGG